MGARNSERNQVLGSEATPLSLFKDPCDRAPVSSSATESPASWCLPSVPRPLYLLPDHAHGSVSLPCLRAAAPVLAVPWLCPTGLPGSSINSFHTSSYYPSSCFVLRFVMPLNLGQRMYSKLLHTCVKTSYREGASRIQG